jgi:hypothetical protein
MRWTDYVEGDRLRGWLLVVAGWCTLFGEAACAARDEREAPVVAFYRLHSIGGQRLPITLRFRSPVGGINLSSGSLTLHADGRYIGRFRLYDALPGVGAMATVTDLAERGRYRSSQNRLVLESPTRPRAIVLEVAEGGTVLRGRLVGGASPYTDTLGVARYERNTIPPDAP